MKTLADQIQDIEARLLLIENALQISPANQAIQVEVDLVREKKRAVKLLHAAKTGNWLGIVANLCLILAISFIIKLSIDSGWLTPEKQLGLATLFGISVIVLGLKLLNLRRNYANLIPAAGVIVLFLTVFSAHRYYQLISFQTAIAMISVVTGLSIWFYIKLKHDIYAIIAALGAYLGPFILILNGSAIFTLYYYVICAFTFSTLSIWVQSRTLTVISAYLAILITSIIGMQLEQDGLISIVLALYFFIFSIGTYFHTQLTQKQLSEGEAWSLFPILLFLYAMEFYFIDRIHPELAPWVCLGFAVLLMALCFSTQKWLPGRYINSQEMILAFATIVFFHSVYLELLPSMVRPWLFVIIILGFSRTLDQFYPKIARVYIVPVIALFLFLGMEYLTMLYHLLVESNWSWVLVAFAGYLSICYLLYYQRKTLTAVDEYTYPMLLGSAHLLCIMCLFQLTLEFGSLAISTSWLLYSLGIIGLAYWQRDKKMAKTALFPLLFATGKALLYDATSAPTPTSIFCLLLTGIILYGSSIVIRNSKEWTR